jgi:hypothetical protein
MRSFLRTIVATVLASFFYIESVRISSACDRSFVVQDLTNFPYEKVLAQGEGIIRGRLDYSTTSRPRLMEVAGSGPATFTVVLVSGHTLTRTISDVCSATQIIIEERDGDLRLIVR